MPAIQRACSPYLTAEVGLWTEAKLTLPTLRDVERDHMIAWEGSKFNTIG